MRGTGRVCVNYGVAHKPVLVKITVDYRRRDLIRMADDFHSPTRLGGDTTSPDSVNAEVTFA